MELKITKELVNALQTVKDAQQKITLLTKLINKKYGQSR